MSNSRRLTRQISRKPRTMTLEKLEKWLETLDPAAPGVSMIDGYLAALVVSPQFIPPKDWLPPILGDEISDALEGSIEATVRNTIFQRYNQIGATLSGGPKRYAPIFMRTDDDRVLLTKYANGFYLGMQLSIDDWKFFMADPEIGIAMMAILAHSTEMAGTDEHMALANTKAASALAESWRVVHKVVEMLHVMIAGARNVEIR